MTGTWLVTGGTGTFGREALRQLLAAGADKVRILSRDEAKQAELRATLSAEDRARAPFILGDVRDRDRMAHACRGVDYVLHAAALKRVEAVQGDVREAVATNVLGTLSVAEAAEQAGARACVLVSSDKAADPINAYGVSKLMAEHAMLCTRFAWGASATRLLAVRYGNVWGSRGSLVETILRARTEGRVVEVRARHATRFFLPIERAVRLAIGQALDGVAGTLAVPDMKAASIGDIVEAADVKTVDAELPATEKLHETAVTRQEMQRSHPSVIGGVRCMVVPVPDGPILQPLAGPITSDRAPRVSVGDLALAFAGEESVW